MSTRTESVTKLLERLNDGDRAAGDELMKLAYPILRTIAAAQLRRQRPGHTLQPTALVHEAYVKLAGSAATPNDRGHFYALAARAMRQILVDHARSHGAKKNRERARVTQVSGFNAEIDRIDLLALDEALSKLETVGAQHARIVELRFFAGLSMKEIADVLGTPLRTVERGWRAAKAWLYRELGDETDAGPK